MDHLLALAVSFPAVVYTVLLGVALVYWVFVMVGAAHVNLLGEGAADAAFEGAAKGALEGVAKGAFEGAAKGAFEGAAAHLEGGAEHLGDAGAQAGLIESLRLRSAPATVVLSAILLFAWVLAMAGMLALEPLALDGALLFVAEAAVFLAAPVLALFPASLAVRPMARVFTPPKATTHDALVGKLCTIRTGTVTERFGEALLDDGGAGVVVRVRVDAGEVLLRGEQAVIVGYDASSQEFTVAPMRDVLDEAPASKGARQTR